MTIDLDTLTLAHGAHETRDDGLCLLEAVAWWAGKDHTDQPPCVSPVLGAYGRSLNDLLPETPRQLLKPYIPLLPGTAGDGKDETRGHIALDWLIRTWIPAWLDLAGLGEEASSLRDFRRIADLAAAQAVRPHVLAGRDNAARAAARAAAWAAARDAAWAKLAPTVEQLQQSAISLYGALIAGEWPPEVTP